MLKKISTMARNDCEKFMGTKVYLRCWVKVKENWRDSDFLLKNFGYRDQVTAGYERGEKPDTIIGGNRDGY